MKNSAPNRSLGRPKNIFGVSPADLEERLRFPAKATLEEALSLDVGFGTVGYSYSKTKQHLARLELIPTDGSASFFWVRLQTPTLEVDFSVPMTVSRADLKDLVEMWEFDQSTKWHEGAPALPHFPSTWRMPYDFTTSAHRFYTLSFNEDQKVHVLAARAGIHTMRAQYLGQRTHCGGVLGLEDPWLLVRLGRTLAEGTQLPEGITGRVTGDVLHACWRFSAACFRRYVLTPVDGRSHGVVPHWDSIGIPLAATSPFTLERR